jgi:hypothetical protein
MARLEKWSLVGFQEEKPLAVRGEIHGDERFSDGTPITSSRLVDLDASGRFACTRNHSYELGTMSDAFARWMAEQGRTLAAYGAALTAKTAAKPKTNAAKVMPMLRESATVVTRETPHGGSDVRRAIVQAPTRIVAAG